MCFYALAIVWRFGDMGEGGQGVAYGAMLLAGAFIDGGVLHCFRESLVEGRLPSAKAFLSGARKYFSRILAITVLAYASLATVAPLPGQGTPDGGSIHHLTLGVPLFLISFFGILAVSVVVYHDTGVVQGVVKGLKTVRHAFPVFPLVGLLFLANLLQVALTSAEGEVLRGSGEQPLSTLLTLVVVYVELLLTTSLLVLYRGLENKGEELPYGGKKPQDWEGQP
jgi:hypothetical protein